MRYGYINLLGAATSLACPQDVHLHRIVLVLVLVLVFVLVLRLLFIRILHIFPE